MAAQLVMFKEFADLPAGDANLSQWCTERHLAARLLKWAGIRPGQTVLEPSCGTGAFVGAALEHGCRVIANDIDPRMADYVQGVYGQSRSLLSVTSQDFLFMAPPTGLDWVVMHPPGERGQDKRHIQYATSMAPNVLALIPAATLHGKESRRRIWRRELCRRIGLFVCPPHFSLGGLHGSYPPRRDYCVVILTHGSRCAPSVEWLL